MKVSKSARKSEPGYPSFRQVSESKVLVGLATLGLSAATGLADPASKDPAPRLGGKPSIEPRSQSLPATNTAPSACEASPARLAGAPAVEPPMMRTSGIIATRPADSNALNRVVYRVKAGDTLQSIALAVLGDGERWKEIAALNPGLTPESFKAGQAAGAYPFIYVPVGKPAR